MSVIGDGATKVVHRPLLKDLVYARLLAAINDGTLLPGERLRDRELEAWLGVSRTPIRQALDKLQEAGLVDVEANRYTRVAPARPSLVVDQMEIVVTMWQLGTTLAVLRASDEEIDALAREVARAAATVEDVAEGRRQPGTAFPVVLDALGIVCGSVDNHTLTEILSQVQVGLIHQLRLMASSFDTGWVLRALRMLEHALRDRDQASTLEALEQILRASETLAQHVTEGQP